MRNTKDQLEWHNEVLQEALRMGTQNPQHWIDLASRKLTRRNIEAAIAQGIQDQKN